jgi:hypothetical protein
LFDFIIFFTIDVASEAREEVFGAEVFVPIFHQIIVAVTLILTVLVGDRFFLSLTLFGT